MRVLVLDEQEVVRRGVSRVLGGDPAITVVAEAASVGEAVARGLAVRPDVAVVGMRLPDGSGAEAFARLRSEVPGLRCLVLSSFCDPPTVRQAVRLGVEGYLVNIPVADRGHRRIRIDLHGGIVTGLPLPASETPGLACPSRTKWSHGTPGSASRSRPPEARGGLYQHQLILLPHSALSEYGRQG